MAGNTVTRSATSKAGLRLSNAQSISDSASINANKHSLFYSAQLVCTCLSMLVFHSTRPAAIQHKATVASRVCQNYLNEGWLAISTHAFICDLSQCATTFCHTPTRGSCITQRLSCLLSTAFTVIPVKPNNRQNKDICIYQFN